MRTNLVGGVLGLALLAFGCGAPEDLQEASELDTQQQAAESGTTEPAYFLTRESPDSPAFIVRINDPRWVEYARSLLAEGRPATVGGVIKKKKAAYNSNWSFHLDPDQINFEVSGSMHAPECESPTRYVETRLEEVGGSFLPYSRWCSSSRLIREVQR